MNKQSSKTTRAKQTEKHKKEFIRGLECTKKQKIVVAAVAAVGATI